MAGGRTKVVIAGGGVAAVELMLGLRKLAGHRVELVLVSPSPELVYRPLATAEAAGVGSTPRLDLRRIAADVEASVSAAALTAVDADRRRAGTTTGDDVEYDALAVVTGARRVEALPGALTFRGEVDREPFQRLLEDLGGGTVERVVFTVPGGVAWTLPLYELALMTAARLAKHDVRGVELTLTTTEDAPLAIFGTRASQAIAGLLERRGIAVVTGAAPAAVEEGALTMTSGRRLAADRVVGLPRLEGPRINGLPHDDDGFVPTDAHGRVSGVQGVYAAGDVTTFPIKQGGLATQQADAVAEAVAAGAGADVEPKPFRPVLRGLVLTGDFPSYLKSEPTAAKGEGWEPSFEPLWWPPTKIAGRYLSRYYASLTAAEPAPPSGLRVEVDDLEPFLP